MPKRLSTVQFSVLLGVILALFASGIVAGAAGSAIILGTANDAGVSNTTIKTNSSGMAMQMNNLGTGVGGFFLSTSGVGLAAQTSLGSKYAGSFTNQGVADGGGAAILATGKANYGIVATSDGKPPIKVTAAGGVAPFEVNSGTTVTNLSADSVDGYHASAINRVAFNATDFLVDGASASSASLSAVINAPGPGFLLIWGHGNAFLPGSDVSGEFSCHLEVNNAYVNGSSAWLDLVYDATYDLDDGNCDSSGGQVVCSAAEYTVEYTVSSVDTTTQIQYSTVMVEYVPFDGDGNAALCVASAPLPIPQRTLKGD
jgi:hypothetical protein